MTYGLSHQASVSARDLELTPTGARYTATLDGRPLGPVTLAVPGAHNVANSLAAVAVGLDLDVPFDAVRAGLESFTGVDRRFQVRGEAGGRPGDRRLRPPPDRDPRHPRGAAPARGRAAHGRALPAAPLHAHPGPLGRLLQGLPPGRRAAADRHLPRVRGADPRRHGGGARAGDRRARPPAGRLGGGPEGRPPSALAAEVREGDVVLTLGAGSVWTAGEELLRRRGA